MAIETVVDVIRHNRRQWPDKTALTFTPDGRSWTYRQLDDESNRVANALLQAGINPQQRIAFLNKNTPEFIACQFGANKVNAVMTPLNWRLASREIEYILQNSEARVLIIGEEFLPHLDKIDIDGIPVIVIGEQGKSGFTSYREWIATQSADDPGVQVGAADTCCQMYTSGTTGLPKGVETTHRNLTAVCLNNLAVTGVTADSAMLTFMPLFHLSGTLITMLGFFAGGHTVLQQEANLQEVQQSIPEYRISHMTAVPAFLKLLIELPNAREVDYDSLVAVFYGGSPITEDVMTRVIDVMGKVGFMQGFGLTESTGGFTSLSPEDHLLAASDPAKSHLLRSCGRLCMPEHEMKIVDPETGEEKASNEVGEIWVRGPQVMKGYWKNPEATSETITPEGWLRTGDAAYIDSEGYLYIKDRIKQMIISGGENIYPAEVENALQKHPHITDVTVIGIPHEKWGETVLAICVRDDESLTEEQLIEHCREYLARYKCPTKIEWRDEIPRNASGKVQKHILREPYWKNQGRAVS